MYQNVLIVATVIAIIVVVFLTSIFTTYLTKKKINVTGAIAEAKAEIPIFEQVEAMLAMMVFVTAIQGYGKHHHDYN